MQDWYKDWYKRTREIYNSEWDRFLREYVFSPEPPFKIVARQTHMRADYKLKDPYTGTIPENKGIIDAMTQSVEHTEDCNYGVTSIGCAACALHKITNVVLAYRPKIKTKAAKRRARRNKRASKAKDKPKSRE